MQQNNACASLKLPSWFPLDHHGSFTWKFDKIIFSFLYKNNKIYKNAKDTYTCLPHKSFEQVRFVCKKLIFEKNKVINIMELKKLVVKSGIRIFIRPKFSKLDEIYDSSTTVKKHDFFENWIFFYCEKRWCKNIKTDLAGGVLIVWKFWNHFWRSTFWAG